MLSIRMIGVLCALSNVADNKGVPLLSPVLQDKYEEIRDLGCSANLGVSWFSGTITDNHLAQSLRGRRLQREHGMEVSLGLEHCIIS
jgi:hypothetical protein